MRDIPDTDIFQRALPYYVVALGTFFRQYNEEADGPANWSDIDSYWSIKSTELTDLLNDGELLQAAFGELSACGLIEVLADDFGPTIYVKNEDFDDCYQNLTQGFPLFSKYDRAGHRWLMEALLQIKYKVEEKEPDQPKSTDEWQPLEIDRSSEALQNVTKKLDTTIEALRQDNGYGSRVLD